MPRRHLLLGLMALNLVASILHIVDNIWFFESYPEPDWITSPGTVDLLWLVATPLLLFGYWLYRKRSSWLGFALLVTYSLMSLSVLGHYLYALPWELPLRVNFFIGLETFAALSLVLSVIVLQARADRFSFNSLAS